MTLSTGPSAPPSRYRGLPTPRGVVIAMATTRSKNVVPTGCWRPPTLPAPVLCRVSTARRRYPGGNFVRASQRTITSPAATLHAALTPGARNRCGLGTIRTEGYRSSITLEVAAVSEPSATITSKEPG